MQVGALGVSVNTVPLSVEDYLNSGMILVAQNCSGWFGTQISSASSTAMLQGLLGLAGAGAGAAGGPIAAAVAGGGVSALGIYQSNQPGGAMPALIYTVVRRELQAYTAAMPTPITKLDAQFLIEGAAEYCQGSAIAGAVYAALSTVPVTATAAAGSFSSSAAAVPRRVLPPVVTVGTPPQASAAIDTLSMDDRVTPGAAIQPQTLAEGLPRYRARARAKIAPQSPVRPRSLSDEDRLWFQKTSTCIRALDWPRC